MTIINTCAIFSLLVYFISSKNICSKTTNNISRNSMFLLFVSAFLVRAITAISFRGFTADMDCFIYWADRMYSLGPASFYSSDLFCDYPPGYLYILYPLGMLRSIFSLPSNSVLSYFIIKLPAILCDMGTGYLLYQFTKKKTDSNSAFYLSMIYLFQPVIWANSSLWGQVDSVFTFSLVFMCLKLMEGHMLPSYIAFGIGVLLKPQMLVFTPILLLGITEQVLLKDLSLKSFFQNLLQGCLVIFGMLLLCLPFGLTNCIKQYANTLGSYPYASVNAYNFWSMLGLNWADQNTMLGFLPCKTWGTLCILTILVFVVYSTIKSKLNEEKYPLLAAFIIINLFVFSVRMHERYMYPGLILLLLSYVCLKEKHLLYAFQGFALVHLYNTLHVLFLYNPTQYEKNSITRTLISLGTLICAVYLNHTIANTLFQKPVQSIVGSQKASKQASKNIASKVTSNPSKSINVTTLARLTSLDVLLILGISLVYSIFAFHDLGDRKVPKTVYSWSEDTDIILEFSEQTPTKLSYYLAPNPNVILTYTDIPSNIDSSYFGLLTAKNLTLNGSVYTWNSVPLILTGNSLLLRLDQAKANILELVFTDINGNILIPQNAKEYPELFDENHLYPSQFSYRNSMYFDEIYHARTAKEYLDKAYSYENTHPPLGKAIISWGIALFGMSPFGWRIMGTLFGIAMLPFIYLFAKRLTTSTLLSACACTIFAFDFMHFTQTRIATIDVFVTFFVIAMYYFMLVYLQDKSMSKTKQQKYIPLALSGISMGLGIASKWTGIYAGAGLAVIFFAALMLEYRNCKAHTRHRFHQETLQTCYYCIIFFVLIPGIIYTLSYIPFRDGSGQNVIMRMINNQKAMLSYHSSLNATHPFSSPFYSWPFISKPIWYYSGILDDNLREGISAFGNPLVWWVGIPAFLYVLYQALRKKDRIAGFLIIGYLAQYLPWMFVDRLTFIYHYFPSVPFVVFMIIYSLSLWEEKLPKKIFYGIVIVYSLAVVGLFLLFYPVLSGQPIDGIFVKEHLRLMKDWILVSI